MVEQSPLEELTNYSEEMARLVSNYKDEKDFATRMIDLGFECKEKEIEKVLRERVASISKDLEAGKSSGDELVDYLVKGFEIKKERNKRFRDHGNMDRCALFCLIDDIKEISKLRSDLQSNRGGFVLNEYSQQSCWQHSFTDSDACKYETIYLAEWGTISKEGNALILKKQDPHNHIELNTGGKHIFCHLHSFYIDKNPEERDGNMWYSLLESQRSYTFGKKAEKRIEEIKAEIR